MWVKCSKCIQTGLLYISWGKGKKTGLKTSKQPAEEIDMQTDRETDYGQRNRTMR